MAVLKRGSTGPEVVKLQQRLAELGFDPNGVDGVFGADTESAVKAFQQAKGLVVDGVVGPDTRDALGLDGGGGAVLNFVGPGTPLDDAGLSEVLNLMGTGKPEIWAVLTVETSGWGFLPDRRPVILFERHKFSSKTNHQFDATHPDISNPNAGGYGAGGAHQYDRLQRAINLNRKAALESTSWGIGQLMGFNAQLAGYSDVEAMVAAMVKSENDQLLGMTGEIVHGNLHVALRNHHWADFALGYNGANYAINHYDTRLAAAYQRYAQGNVPDLIVRTAQAYLTYLGFNPGGVDGIAGSRTFAAVHKFQEQNGLPVNNTIDDALIALLKQKVLGTA